MTNDKSQINFEVDRDAKELAKDKLDYGELSTELRETIHRIAFGDEISKRERAHKRLAELREEKDSIRGTIRQKQTELEEVEDEIARLEERIDNLERREDKYEATLEMLEEILYAGQRVFKEHGQVMKAAKVGGVDAEDVLEELKERNPQIPDHAFQQAMHSSKKWRGVTEESDA